MYVKLQDVVNPYMKESLQAYFECRWEEDDCKAEVKHLQEQVVIQGMTRKGVPRSPKESKGVPRSLRESQGVLRSTKES